LNETLLTFGVEGFPVIRKEAVGGVLEVEEIMDKSPVSKEFRVLDIFKSL
jgi:hypothetical protein